MNTTTHLSLRLCGVAALLSAAAIAQAAVPAAAAPPAAPAITRPALLPEAISSFGACRVGSWLYVYGGHVGRAHAHSRENVVGSFGRLNLADGKSWQALPAGPALQGTALVAAEDGRLYRVGGTDARNERGDEQDMHSTASVACFDPRAGRWRDVTPLPEPRSSHDAIVCDGRLYVVGGWNLQGAGDGEWHDTAWVADLAEEPLVWRALPPPGAARRACALATFDGQVVVLGGMRGSEPIRSVRVYDPTAGAWRDGPDLPGFAFGTAAVGVDDTLFATVMDGRVLAWRGAGDWQPVAQLETPRFFHRCVAAPQPGRLLVCGGAARGGHLRTLEHVDVTGAAPPEFREYVLPAPSKVAYRQALLLQDDTLWALGGNRGLPGERFDAGQFADEVWKVELTTMTAQVVGRLPAGGQSMAAVRWGGRRDNLVLGGLGPVDGQVQSLASAFRWDMRRQVALPCDAALPAPRTQCQVVRHDGLLYVVGGVDFQPDGDGGGSTKGDARELLVYDPEADEPRFLPAGITLPRPRRSFGAAVLDGRLYLVGGLGDGFEHAGPCDVYDFASGTWSELDAPVDWVSPQVAVIGARLYVGCGGTMRGQRFRQDRSLRCFEPDAGWSVIVDELPFAVRHVRMLGHRNRLLFYAANDPRGDRIVLRTFEPDARVQVLEASLHR